MLSLDKALRYAGSFLSVVAGAAIYFAVLYGTYEIFVGSALSGFTVIAVAMAGAYMIQRVYSFLCPQP